MDGAYKRSKITLFVAKYSQLYIECTENMIIVITITYIWVNLQRVKTHIHEQLVFHCHMLVL